MGKGEQEQRRGWNNELSEPSAPNAPVGFHPDYLPPPPPLLVPELRFRGCPETARVFPSPLGLRRAADAMAGNEPTPSVDQAAERLWQLLAGHGDQGCLASKLSQLPAAVSAHIPNVPRDPSGPSGPQNRTDSQCPQRPPGLRVHGGGPLGQNLGQILPQMPSAVDGEALVSHSLPAGPRISQIPKNPRRPPGLRVHGGRPLGQNLAQILPQRPSAVDAKPWGSRGH